MGSAELHDTKTCPECAEEVKAAAKVCRFCGHRFQEAPIDDVAQPDDPLAAYANKYARAQPSTNVDAPLARPSWIDRHKVLFGIGLTLVALIVILVIAAAVNHSSDPSAAHVAKLADATSCKRTSYTIKAVPEIGDDKYHTIYDCTENDVDGTSTEICVVVVNNIAQGITDVAKDVYHTAINKPDCANPNINP